ncbi:MAG: hypothetical protein ABI813_10370 [Bacteroidota bacterium]
MAWKKKSCIIIASDAHIGALEARLKNLEIAIIPLLSAHLYILLNAEKLLSLFMINSWPEESLFNRTVNNILLKARGCKRRPCEHLVKWLLFYGETAIKVPPCS